MRNEGDASAGSQPSGSADQRVVSCSLPFRRRRSIAGTNAGLLTLLMSCWLIHLHHNAAQMLQINAADGVGQQPLRGAAAQRHCGDSPGDLIGRGSDPKKVDVSLCNSVTYWPIFSLCLSGSCVPAEFLVITGRDASSTWALWWNKEKKAR